MRKSCAFTRTEVLVTVVVVCLLLGLLFPALQYSIHRSRRSMCTSNMGQFGIALHMYADVERSFPPGGIARDDDPVNTLVSIHGLLVPYFEESSIKSLYQAGKDWRQQLPFVPHVVLPLFNCPSSTGENPVLDRLRNELTIASETTYPPDQLFGTTNYVFCKGVTDAWCRCWKGGLESVPPSERGLFDMNWSVKIGEITDGTSQTIAMGEGSDSRDFLLCDRTAGQIHRHQAAPVDKYARLPHPYQAWLAMDPANVATSAQGLRVASLLACTLEPLNKNPVTDAWADVDALDDCRKSLPSAAGTRGPTTQDGPHSTPNFRSDHSGGGNFLFADGAVHFLSEDIDMLLYQRLSTHQGGEPADTPP